MHYGYRIVEDMADGLLAWMRRKGYETLDDFRGLSLPNVTRVEESQPELRVVARIHEDKCIGCQLCYTACWDGAHQCIHLDRAACQNQEHDPRYTPTMVESAGKPHAASATTTPIREARSEWRGRNQPVSRRFRAFRASMSMSV